MIFKNTKNLKVSQLNILYNINLLKKENNNIAYIIQKFYIINSQIINNLTISEKIAYQQLIDIQYMHYKFITKTLLVQKEMDTLFTSLNNFTDCEYLINSDICDEEILNDFKDISINLNQNLEVLISFIVNSNNYFIKHNSILNSNNLKLNGFYIEFALNS